MARARDVELPACYAMTLPGMEAIAADEITRDLGGEVKKAERGIVVFRVDAIGPELLELRCVEDVYLLAWGTDALTHRAIDLKQIQYWTRKSADWKRLLSFHHALRPKPKGKPTYRYVAQMTGRHVYHRKDAAKAVRSGMEGVFPDSWQQAEENAAVEVWITIQGTQAVCGLRLSDRTMRHRTWKVEHRSASLRPSLAAAMVRLAGIGPDMIVLDPMCGTGTIPAETLELQKRRHGDITFLAGDIETDALRAAETNLRRVGKLTLAKWDALRLPLPLDSVDRIICNPPFGRQLSTPEEIGQLYYNMIRGWNRVLKPDGRAVLLVSDMDALRAATKPVGWQAVRQQRVEVLGQDATVSVWRKPSAAATTDDNLIGE